MDEPLRVVFDSPNRRACADRALVLEAVGIAHEILADESGYALLVAAADSARAADELRLYDTENPPGRPPAPAKVVYHEPLYGIIAYFLVVGIVAWLAGAAAMNFDWVAAGRVDGNAVRDGQIWRTITALTLHSGPSHLAGNLVFGGFFGFFAGRLLGSGVGWLVILLAGMSGNLLNTLLLESTHRSIGASTAVFAALGIVAGFVWRARLMNQERWSYRLGPVVGGLALLMFTGTGDANTDIGAHLMGFVCGFGAGIGMTRLQAALVSGRVQQAAGAAALLLIGMAWWLALRN